MGAVSMGTERTSNGLLVGSIVYRWRRRSNDEIDTFIAKRAVPVDARQMTVDPYS